MSQKGDKEQYHFLECSCDISLNQKKCYNLKEGEEGRREIWLQIEQKLTGTHLYTSVYGLRLASSSVTWELLRGWEGKQ